MFGYVKTDDQNLYIKDFVLYRSLYCGLCKSIGGTCGQKARLALNYDLTFLSAFFHNILGVDVQIEKKRCVTHWFKRRQIAKRDALTDKIACLNVILAYHKLTDDVIDNGKGRLKRSFFKSSYKKAVKREPELDEIVKRNYQILLDYEKAGGESIDIASDSFANMIKEISMVILADKSTEITQNISYNLGKWIYLIDALDDFDKDLKKNQYNPFVKTFPNVKSKQELIKQYLQDIEYIFGELLISIANDAKKIDYKFNHDLTDNIIFRGLAKTTQAVMQPCKKGKKDERIL